MIKYKIFLEWWWFFCTACLIGTVLASFNVFEILWNSDKTKITFVIISLFTFISLFCGYEAWRLNKIKINNQEPDEDLKRKYETGWFSSEICLTLGLIGTVSGFILMLVGAFAELNISDPDSVQQSLMNMSLGMSTALYTTLVGLIASVILKVQFFRLESHFDNFVKEKKDEKRSL